MMWYQIVQNYWRVTVMRDTPANTPYSPTMLALASFLFLLIVSVQRALAVKDADLASSLAGGIIILFSYYLYTYVVLRMSAKKNRFVQTLSCLLFSYLIIHLMAFPLIIITQYLVGQENSLVVVYILMILFLCALFLAIWQFLVTASIFRHALDLSFFQGIMVCLGLVGFSIVILSIVQ